tara:strand:- start:1439 stop:1873 length:435 start_codon:yes stop_codon:yes gene_type:complete
MAGPHGILNGTEIKVYTGSDLIMYGTSATLTINLATRETTGFHSQAWESCMEGTRSWSIDADGMYAWETDAGTNPKNGDYLFKQYIRNRNMVEVHFGTKDAESGDVRYFGNAYVTNLSMTGGTEDSATFSVSFKGSGILQLHET